LRSYKLSDPELRARFDHHADSDSIETVRAEVVLLRTLIDERLSLARTEADKIAAFQVIHPAISTLNKLVESLCKLEKSTHLVLGKEALNRLGDKIVTILIEELSEVEGYTDIIDRVAGRIAAAISESRNTD
jgi:signal transduction histidine kinase